MQAEGTMAGGQRVAVVRLERTLRAPIAHALRQKVQTLLRRGAQQVVLDLECLEAIDAAGIGELVGAFTTARAAGGVVRITHPGRHVRRLLHVAGVLGLLSGNSAEPVAGVRRPCTPCVQALRGALACA